MSAWTTTSPSSLLVMECTVLDRFGNEAISPVHIGLPMVRTLPSPRSTRRFPPISLRPEEMSAFIEHMSVMPSTSWARYRSKNSVTTPAAEEAERARWVVSLMSAAPSRDRDLVVALHGQAPVQLRLAPVGVDAADQPAGHDKTPGLVDVQVLFLVDGAGVVGGLGALGLEQRGDHVAGGDDPADADHQVGKGPHQVGHYGPQHVRTLVIDAERMHGDRGLRIDQSHRGVDVVPGQSVQEFRYGLRGSGHAATPRAGASSFLMTASAVASVEPGFCPVMTLRSTTTCEIHAAGPSSKTAPAFFSATSSSQAMPSRPAPVWSSSSSVKEVIR